MALWPDPAPFWLALIGIALVLIHALPLLARLWSAPPDLRRTLELCLLALVPVAIAKWQMWSIADGTLALVAFGCALLPAIGIARGWGVDGRTSDSRFAWLGGTAAALVALASGLLLPFWLLPVGIAAIAAALLLFGQTAADRRIEWVAAGFSGVALVALVATPRALDELPRLASGAGGAAGEAFLRWGMSALAALFFAFRAERPAVRRLGQISAAALAYGATAQMLPAAALVLVPAIGGAALLLAARRMAFARFDAGAATFAAISLAWAALPVAVWSAKALLSLGGMPMQVEDDALRVADLIRRLALPALLFGVPLWLLRDKLPRWLLFAVLGVAGAIATIAVHAFYRLGFAALAGSDFVATGIVQRLLWEALLIGAGGLLWRRGFRAGALVLVAAGAAHAFYYGLALHNPLWAEQAVGGWPFANLLAPLFLLPWFAMRLAAEADRADVQRWPIAPSRS